ncbi:recombinase family protein [Nocardiopsis nanhaiensis]
MTPHSAPHQDRKDVDYCRISLDKTGAADGVDSQHEENADFAQDMDRPLSGHYEDNDLSAFTGVERPDYQRLRADMAADQIASVTFWHANRLHREIEEAVAFMKLAIKHRVRLFSFSKGGEYNLNRPAGREAFLSDTLKGQLESEERGDRVALARKRQARHGTFGGGVRPYGFGVDTGRVRSVCVNPKAPPMERVWEDRPVLDMSKARADEKAEIRKWADDLLDGVSERQVLADMRKRGVLTVSQKDGRVLRRNGQVIESAGWNVRTLKNILTSPRVSGHAHRKGQITKRGAYEQILPDDVREALITLFSDPTRKKSPGNTPKWLGSLIYLCGDCDNGEATMTVRRNQAGVPVYRCRDKGHCSRPAHALDAVVTTTVIKRLARADVAELITQTPEVDVAELRSEAAVLDQRKQQAALQFADGTIDAAQLATITTTIGRKLTQVQGELSAAAKRSPLVDFIGVQDARKVWEGLTLGRKREVLRAVFTITPRPLGQGRGAVAPHERVDFAPPTPPAQVAA